MNEVANYDMYMITDIKWLLMKYNISNVILTEFVQVIFKTSYHCILSLYMCQLIIF